LQTEEIMEITQDNFEFVGGGVNPWAKGVYSPQVHVTEINDPELPVEKDDDEDEFQEPAPADQNEPIVEKVVADLDEYEGDQPSENIHAVVTAKKLKEEGWLNVEDIPEDIDYPQIYDLYKTTAKERLLHEVQSEVNMQLESAGINEQNISILSALENGIPLDEISDISRFKKYVSLNPADESEERKLAVIKDRYLAIGLRDKDLERQVNAIESSGEVDEAFEESQAFFKGVVSDFDKTQVLMAQEAIKKQNEIKQKNQTILDKAIKLGELGGQKLTNDQQKDLQKAIYDRNVVLEIENQQYAFSPFEEFLYKMNNDFEFQLTQFRSHLFKDKDTALIKAKAKHEASSDDWDAVRRAQEGAAQRKSVKRGDRTDQPVRQEQRGISFEIEVPRR
jgi:hypothetical protein